MEALQRLHMSPVGSPFGMNHHESMLRANANVASHDDRKSPMDTRLIMQVRKKKTFSVAKSTLEIALSVRRTSVRPNASFTLLRLLSVKCLFDDKDKYVF